MQDQSAWISWNEGLVLVGSSASGFDAFLKRKGIPVHRVAGGRLLPRAELLRAVDEDFARAACYASEQQSS